MAFNFNWSPLMADASFYTRAQDLLTAALNKSPKPPIIVDDIIVTELNLGSIPPDLEILEIGDLAEDRFRGIFKMSYSGDAFLTLKTRVQANPLNTYLLTRPSWGTPTPLAAATPLTIPLQITLSDFKLSGFVVLVFSKQKGITVVFRNDPLESLKVSSTFDSIHFVRNFLQKEIEAQLRTLFMDELPAIIHRLSLRLWVPEYRADEEVQNQASRDGPGQDPLASPPQDPVDSFGNALSESQIAALSLDSSVETHSLFSQKNLLRLAALTDSQRTLSLFTPSIHEVVYRACTSPPDQGDPFVNVASPLAPSLVRTQSHTGSVGSGSFSESASTMSLQSRPSLLSHNFSSYGSSLGGGRHKANARRRKKRVVDLRRPTPAADTVSVSDESVFTESTSASSVCSTPAPISEESEEQPDDPVTPPLSPVSGRRLSFTPERRRRSLSRTAPRWEVLSEAEKSSPAPESHSRCANAKTDDANNITPQATLRGQALPSSRNNSSKEDEAGSGQQLVDTVLPFVKEQTASHIMDQTLVEKLAEELARRMREEKIVTGGSFCDRYSQEFPPPPAYGQ